MIQLKKAKVKQLRIDYPISISYEFYMPDRRKSDLSNKLESINDMFVKYWLLADDNINIIQEIKATYQWVDKEYPKVIVYINKI